MLILGISRGWGNSNIMILLPESLNTAINELNIAQVKKPYVYRYGSSDVIDYSIDDFWFLSFSELTSNTSAPSAPSGQLKYIIRSEGKQYKLFNVLAGSNIKANCFKVSLNPLNNIKNPPTSYCLRSPVPGYVGWYFVDENGQIYACENGYPDNYGNVVGFCL